MQALGGALCAFRVCLHRGLGDIWAWCSRAVHSHQANSTWASHHTFIFIFLLFIFRFIQSSLICSASRLENSICDGPLSSSTFGSSRL